MSGPYTPVSQMLSRYVKIALVGGLDLVMGTLISSLVSGVFAHVVTPITLNAQTLPRYATLTFLQMVCTLILGHDLRLMAYSAQMEDPTGGILFILSLFRQPSFWQAVDAIRNTLWTMIFPVPNTTIEQPQQG